MRLIDADYILEGLTNFNDRKHGNPHFINGIETAKEMIDNAPTIDPVVRGEWMLDEIIFENSNDCTGGSDKYFVNCSICGHHTAHYQGNVKNYCPNCGAKMDGGK